MTAASIWSLLDAAVRDRPARVAIRTDAAEWSYREFGDQVAGLASRMRELGVATGDRVAILSRNRPEFAAAYFAAAAIGAILVLWNTRLAVAEHLAILEDCGARLLLAERHFDEVVRGLDVTVEWLDDAPAPSSFERIDLAEVSPEDVAHLYYTSGTTGTPKGVQLTHGNVTSHAAMTIFELGLAESDVWGHIAPMFHLADAWATFAITQVGGAHTFVPDFSADDALAAIERHRITISNLVPTMLNAMVAAPAVHDLSSVRCVLSGGAPIAPEAVSAIAARFGCEYVQTYGMTETSPFLTMSLLDDELRQLPEEEQLAWRAKTGRPVQGVELRVVDGGGEDVPRDERTVGEIVVRGPTVTKGYWRNETATRAAFDDVGWLHTGDLAVRDARGFVTIVDRKKDVILTGGETVYSIEVENRLHEHPAVLEVAVFGRPDPKWGEIVQAAVALRDGAAASADGLIAFCREALAGFKAPRAVELLDELPRTGSGKIDKRALRERS